MKRWLAGWLSVMILFAGGAVLAEAPERKENADIEETVVSVEGEELGTLSENLRFLLDLTKNEDVRELLANEEVKNVSSEIIWRVLVWLFQNRPVTMKILAELGVGELDLRCINKLWDSAERIGNALDAHSKSEDGKRLQAEAEAVKNDPELQESLAEFEKLITSGDLTALLDTLKETAETNAAGPENIDGVLTQEALQRNMEHSSFTGSLIFRILSVMDQSEWARNSLPKLLKNENLWRFLAHLSSGNPELDRVLQEECALIAGDPEMNVFLRQTAKEVHTLSRALQDSDTENSETTGEEVTP